MIFAVVKYSEFIYYPTENIKCHKHEHAQKLICKDVHQCYSNSRKLIANLYLMAGKGLNKLQFIHTMEYHLPISNEVEEMEKMMVKTFTIY